MKTEKRPKLLKDISDPWRGEIKAGAILVRAQCAGWWLLPVGDPPRPVVQQDTLPPEWFEWVEVCTECNRETMAGNCTYSPGSHNGCGFCHGHEWQPVVDPIHPPQGSRRETVTAAFNGVSFDLLSLSDNTMDKLRKEIAAKEWNRIYAAIDDKLVSFLYDKLEAERKRREGGA